MFLGLDVLLPAKEYRKLEQAQKHFFLDFSEGWKGTCLACSCPGIHIQHHIWSLPGIRSEYLLPGMCHPVIKEKKKRNMVLKHLEFNSLKLMLDSDLENCKTSLGPRDSAEVVVLALLYQSQLVFGIIITHSSLRTFRSDP